MVLPMQAADPLLFELVDLAQLAFPRPVASAEAVFGGEPGPRRALIDLSGTADPGAALRPDLGYPDEEVLDTLNAVVGDVTAALVSEHPALGEVDRGAVRFEPAAHGALVVTVHAGDDVVYRRLIDRSEQQHFIHTAALFAELEETVEREAANQDALQARIGGASRFGLDVDHGRLALGDDVRFRAQLLCTWHPESRTFMWGWANEAFPAPFRKAVDEVRRTATGFGLRALGTPELLCPELMAHRLAAHAAVKLDALGCWRTGIDGDSGRVIMWLALFEPGADT
jgi:hypothetical protein